MDETNTSSNNNSASPRSWFTRIFSTGDWIQARSASNPTVRFESTDIYQSTTSAASVKNLEDSKDWRVRISLPPGASKQNFYNQMQTVGGGLLSITDGVLFPYTPTMTVTHTARYSEQALTHSNYKGYFYEGSEVAPISLTGDFTCQNEKEAVYVQSVIYFLRTCTKMAFGTSVNAGTPPTLVRLSGYGDYYMPSVTCVITNFTHTMPNDCDYVPFTLQGKSGRMPTMSTISVTLQPMVSRARQAQRFDLEAFSRGDYISKRGDDQGGLL